LRTMAAHAHRQRHGRRRHRGCALATTRNGIVNGKAPQGNWFLVRALRHLPWLFTAAILVPITLTVPAFQHLSYWLELPRQYFAPAMLALALTPIILTGGIDLSVGSTAVLAGVVIGALWRDLGWPIAGALAAGVGAGLLAGLANGLFIT